MALTGANRVQKVEVVAAPLRKQVIELLRDAIILAEYQPGERLVERDLCERFVVSRTVIREALRHLEAEGLVNLVANRGPVVSSTTTKEAKALYEVREALESLAARCFTERATNAQKKRLVKAFTQVEAAYRRETIPDELRAKDEFYKVLTEGCDNPIIASTLRPIQARIQMLRGLSLQAPGRQSASIEELRKMMDAIDRGDAKRAGELAAEHVGKARVAFERMADKNQTAPATP
jgi:DNA-binding GntR family transcriptional regulator